MNARLHGVIPAEPGQIRGDDIEMPRQGVDLRNPLRRPAEKTMHQNKRLAGAGASIAPAARRRQRICSGSHSATSGAMMRTAMRKTIAPMKGSDPMITSPMLT